MESKYQDYFYHANMNQHLVRELLEMTSLVEDEANAMRPNEYQAGPPNAHAGRHRITQQISNGSWRPIGGEYERYKTA